MVFFSSFYTDFHFPQGENGMLELFLEGNFTDTFEVSPAIVENAGAFAVAVKNARFGIKNYINALI